MEKLRLISKLKFLISLKFIESSFKMIWNLKSKLVFKTIFSSAFQYGNVNKTKKNFEKKLLLSVMCFTWKVGGFKEK